MKEGVNKKVLFRLLFVLVLIALILAFINAEETRTIATETEDTENSDMLIANYNPGEIKTDPSLISDELAKLAHYAEDYESGNINYAQLLVYINTITQNINDVLHDIYFQTGTPISNSDIQKIMGKSTGQTNEAWSMWQQKMIALDEPFPIYQKNYFDGRKIQIVVSVQPEIGLKDGKEFAGAIFRINPKFRLEEIKTDISKLNGIIDNIGIYDKTPSQELAKDIADSISKFQNEFRQGTQESGNCEAQMKKIFDSDGIRNEVFSSKIRLNDNAAVFFQYCDKCDVFGRIDIKFEAIGNDGKMEISKEQFMSFTSEQFKKETESAFSEFVNTPNQGLANKLNSLAFAWSQGIYQGETEEDRIQNYNSMKDFYTGLFSSYQKEESKLYQIHYEKELYANNAPFNFDEMKEQFKKCAQYEKIDCEGKIIFKGKDSAGCPLEPICISEKVQSCSADSECGKPLCGSSKCVEGMCKFSGFEECGESECKEGDKDYMKCNSGEVLVRKLCYNGRWKETGEQCSEGYSEEFEEETDSECNSISDCSGEDEVCSAGKCISVPENEEVSNEEILKEADQENEVYQESVSVNEEKEEEQVTEPKEEQEDQEVKEEQESSSDSAPTTGAVVKWFFTGKPIEENNEITSEEGNNEEVNENQELESVDNLEESDEVEDGDNETELSDDIKEKEFNAEDKEDEFKEKEDYMEDYGKVILGGTCWEEGDGKTSGDIYFNMEGKFGRINEAMKNENNYENNWCIGEVKEMILERKALENGLNDDFAKWFFEEYLANNANQWQRRSDALQQIYNYDMKLSEMLYGNKECSGNYKIPEAKLITAEYESESGSFKFWEKILTAENVGRDKEKTEVVAPYMTSWIWPSNKEFLEQNLINDPRGFGDVDQPYRGAGMFEEENEIEYMPGVNEKVNALIDNYGNGKSEILIEIRFIDFDNDKTIMKLPIVFTRKDISMADEVNTLQETSPDIVVNADFNKLYDIIESIQKENKENFIIYPQWDKGIHLRNSLSEFVNSVEIGLKVSSIISSIETVPEDAKSDLIDVIKTFIQVAMGKE